MLAADLLHGVEAGTQPFDLGHEYPHVGDTVREREVCLSGWGSFGWVGVEGGFVALVDVVEVDHVVARFVWVSLRRFAGVDVLR